VFCGITKQNHRSQCSGNSKNEYGRLPAEVTSIKAWYSKFVETDSFGDLDGSDRPSVSDENVDAVREVFQRSPGKSTRSASNMLKCTNVL